MKRKCNRYSVRKYKWSILIALILGGATIYMNDSSQTVDCVTLQMTLLTKWVILALLIPCQLYAVAVGVSDECHINKITRYNSVREWWKKLSCHTFRVAMVVSAMIQIPISLSFGALYKGGSWRDAIIYGVCCWIMYSLIICVAGLGIQLLMVIQNSQAIAWICVILILAIPTIVTSAFHISYIPDMAEFCNFYLEYAKDGSIFSMNHIAKIINMAVVTLAVYYIGYAWTKRRDLLW